MPLLYCSVLGSKIPIPLPNEVRRSLPFGAAVMDDMPSRSYVLRVRRVAMSILMSPLLYVPTHRVWSSEFIMLMMLVMMGRPCLSVMSMWDTVLLLPMM